VQLPPSSAARSSARVAASASSRRRSRRRPARGEARRRLAVAAEIGRLVVAVDDPFDTERQRVVFALTAKYPRVCVAAPRELERAIARVFGTMS